MVITKIHRPSYLLKRRYRTTLPKSTQKSQVKRTYYKKWLALLIIVIAIHYLITNYFMDLDLSGFKIIDKKDELLTEISQPELDLEEDSKHKPPFNALTLKDYIIKKRNSSYYTGFGSQKPNCSHTRRTGKYSVKLTSIQEMSQINKEYPMVQKGGYYQPLCNTQNKVAIIVPYRDRKEALTIFLFNIHPFLMAQNLEYQIYIIEQSGDLMFNKGRLYNAGFQEIWKLKRFQCVVFHELHLLPTNMEILYSCPKLPRQMSSKQITYKVTDDEIYQYHTSSLMFGGVVSMTMEMVLRANGYSNIFLGQDNDMFWRLREERYSVVRLKENIGVFARIPHKNDDGILTTYFVKRTLKRHVIDGLSTLPYKVLNKTEYNLYTHIIVDIDDFE